MKNADIGSYPVGVQEQQIKNDLAAGLFARFDCTPAVGRIDFAVRVKRKGGFAFDDEWLLWAEAKRVPTEPARMLAQLLLTVRQDAARLFPPKFLGCFDNEKICFVEYYAVQPVFGLNDFNWTQTPSAVDDKTVAAVRAAVPAKAVRVFRFASDAAELAEFVRRNFNVNGGPTLGTQIDKNNFIFVYQKWRAAVMPHVDVGADGWEKLKKEYGIYDRDFFLAELNVDDRGTTDIADDTTARDFYVTFDAGAKKPYRILRKAQGQFEFEMPFGLGKGGLAAYAEFWKKYKRPPKQEYWDYIVERLDLLVPQDVRERKGSFFTPRIWVEKSQEYLARALGENWQDEYYVWDCCGGTGNLEVGLANKYNVFVSTLDQQDVAVIHQTLGEAGSKALLDAHVFQFDFLNDSFDKLPAALKAIVDDPEKRKKLVVYINPPYAEGDSRVGCGRTISEENYVTRKYGAEIGYGKRELYCQFLARIYKEINGCVVGEFSKLKLLQAPKFNEVRELFAAELTSLFIVPAYTFDNVKGSFPIGFKVWRTDKKRVAQCWPNADVYGSDGDYEGTKGILLYDGDKVINDWVATFGTNDATEKSLGTLLAVACDFQHQNTVNLCQPNKPWNHQFQWQVTANNVLESCIYLSVRLCIEATWLNDRDQFLFPQDGWQDDAEFISDCLVFALFHGQNRISSADGANHWIPYTEAEVEAKEKFASHFMTDFMAGRACRAATAATPQQCELPLGGGGRPGTSAPTTLQDKTENIRHSSFLTPNSSLTFSPQARKVLDAGRELWRYYHAQPDADPNASYYDIRAHFQGRKPNGTMNATSDDATYNALLANLRAAHKALAAKIAPKVYDYGFLRK